LCWGCALGECDPKQTKGEEIRAREDRPKTRKKTNKLRRDPAREINGKKNS